MSIRAKFGCRSVVESRDGDGNVAQEQLVLYAVYGKDGTANADWSRWTPCGELTMTVNNPAAFGKIKPGKEYYLDLTEAPAEA